MGLVDEVVPPAIVVDVAARAALARIDKSRDRKRGPASRTLKEALLARNPLGRLVFFDQAKKRTLAKTHGNYPAAEKILEVVRLGLAEGVRAGLGAEATAF